MSGATVDPELARRLTVAHDNVKIAESEVETALREVESAERADKRIISTALRDAFDRLATCRRELEVVLQVIGG